VPKVI